jgi:translation initiation factor 4A
VFEFGSETIEIEKVGLAFLMTSRPPRRPNKRLPRVKNFEPNWEEMTPDFDSMDLKPQLLHGIYSYGFKQPSEIQSLAIKPILDGRHVIAQAQSGTGKTGAFSIGVLNSIRIEERSTQALLLSPTRELAVQTYQFCKDISEKMTGLTIEIFKGGSSVEEDQKRAMTLPHVTIGTPGRILDLINTGHLRCENIHITILDEADEMLSEGFIEQVNEIFSYLSHEVQICLFSATIPIEIFRIMETFMRDPVKILVKAEKLTLEGIKQFYINVGETSKKLETLIDLYGKLHIQKAVIFANSKQTVDFLVEALEASLFTTSAIHAGLSQLERDSIMKQFRLGATRVLISTDLLARGIDVQQITLVINFEIPKEREKYIHRIGRSGRYGRKGVAINICDQGEMRLLNDIERHYATRIEELPENIGEVLKDANEQSG